MLQKGFTLIELMIVVAIIGILSMFALPAYQDYTKRTYVSEGMALSTGAKLAATEYFSTMGSWPADNEAAGLATTISGQAVDNIEVKAEAAKTTEDNPAGGGLITITYGEKVAGAGATATLLLRSSGQSGGSVVWNCSETNAAQGGTKTAGGLEIKWLPNNCRDKAS